LLPVLLPGLVATGALIAVDQILGSAAFGAAAIIAAVLSNAGQSIELVRSNRIVGVSVLFLILAVVNQSLWLSWAILVPDIGTMIFATVTGIITVFNLIWWSLRNLGLRPLFAAGTPGHGRHTEVQTQPASSGARFSHARNDRPHGQTPGIQSGVVLDAHAGERGDVASAEAGDVTGAHVGQTGLLRCESSAGTSMTTTIRLGRSGWDSLSVHP
jgi:uncharacterized protein with PQ loop repeat